MRKERKANKVKLLKKTAVDSGFCGMDTEEENWWSRFVASKKEKKKKRQQDKANSWRPINATRLRRKAIPRISSIYEVIQWQRKDEEGLGNSK